MKMKRKYKTSPCGYEVDLDNPETYNHLPKTRNQLEDKMFSEIGKTLVYMYFLHPDIFTEDCQQRIRIEEFIKKFKEDRSTKYDDLMWWKEQIFLLQDETENQC